jgi:protein SCO1/2
MSRRISLIASAVLLAILAGVAALSLGLFKPHDAPALVGGPFSLVDQDGAPVSETILKGKWSAVFFGYTYCPDICPGTLQALTTAQDQLGPRAAGFRIVFISVDPARDKPAAIKAWLQANAAPKGTLGLSGSPAQTDAAIKAYRVYASKEGDGSSYLMNHSTAVYLMDPTGRFVKVLPYNLPDEIARQTVAAMRGD